ncbi:MAG: hypothetical protein H9Q65_04345 [Spiroplasma ixodetis]|nr:hypothetical protein [Spiroplasma ixodetis]MBP1526868.1 hypothetical protein [Spiroplasma ixodetis]MBP1528453.1 hypothetical protein [Spiroplasma ixodetis]
MNLYWLNKNRNNFEQETNETTKKLDIFLFTEFTFKSAFSGPYFVFKIFPKNF